MDFYENLINIDDNKYFFIIGNICCYCNLMKYEFKNKFKFSFLYNFLLIIDILFFFIRKNVKVLIMVFN